MKTTTLTKLWCAIILLTTFSNLKAQVGIGTTNPNATLEIKATNPITGLPTDGILIPRVDNFPLAANNPTANQDGMLVFLTGNGTPAKGFYYWDNALTNWVTVGGVANTNIPFVTRAELDAIATPENGQMLYDSTDDLTLMWNGTNWIVLSDTCFPQPTAAIAGANQTYNDATVSTTLTANTPIEGTGQWSIIGGTGGSFVDASNPTTTFTGAPCTSYILRWSITTDCRISTDDTSVSFYQTPTYPYPGSSQTFTNGTTSTTLSANTPTSGTGQWSIIGGTGGSFVDATNPTTTFTGNPCTNYVLSWTISACYSSSNIVYITFNELATTANAGTNQTFTDSTTTTTLSANTPTSGTGQWSIISGSGGSFADPTNPTTTFTGNPCTNYQLRWKISACNTTSDDVYINFNESVTTANAGTNIYSLSSTTTTLAANTPTIGSGMWSIISGGTGTFVDPTNPTTSFTADNNNTQYILRWTISSPGACSTSTDDTAVFFGNVIGQYAYGGIIFYVDATGTSGLVCAETSQGTRKWSCTYANIATNTTIGSGAANTSAIGSGGCGFSTTNAAKACYSLNLNGYTDWFLPSQDELIELANNRTIVNQTIQEIGGFQIPSGVHWSSSENSTTTAINISMLYSQTNIYAKVGFCAVRAVRSF